MKGKVYKITETKTGKEYTSWRAVWRDPKGIRKTKRFKTEAEANTHIAIKEIEGQNDAIISHAPRLTTLSEDQLRDAEAASGILSGTGATFTEVAQAYVRKVSHAYLNLGNAVDLFMAAKKREGLRPRSIQGLRHLLSSFQVDRDEKLVSEITETDCERWISEGKAKKSQRERHFALSGLFGWLQGHRIDGSTVLSDNPLANLKPVKVPVKHPEILTTKQCKALMNAAQEHRSGEWTAYFTLALFLAMRPSEISDMAEGAGWERIDLEERTVEIRSNKTGERRSASIPPNALPFLKLARAAGHPIQPPGLAKNQRAIRKAASIDHWPRDVMRHTGISMRVASGETQAAVADWAGNSVAMIRKHYDGLAKKREAVAFHKIAPKRKDGKVVQFKQISA
jgi:integrase